MMKDSSDEKRMICMKCGVGLVLERTNFSYLAHNFFHEIPRCPKCGQTYVSEDLVNSKIAEVEKLLEEK